jgi:hypothetical protein
MYNNYISNAIWLFNFMMGIYIAKEAWGIKDRTIPLIFAIGISIIGAIILIF